MSEFRVEFTELDAQMALRGGYEDESGAWIATMSDEEFRREFTRLEGHIRLRAVLVNGGEHVAIETRTTSATERVLLVEEITKSVARIMLQRLTAASSSQAQSGSALPLC